MKKNSGCPEKLDRKTVERNRRIQMKNLCFKLTSLVPPQHFKPSREMLSQQDQLDQAASYIKKLKERVEELKRKKLEMTMSSPGTSSCANDTIMPGLRPPMVKIRDFGSSLEVVLISGLQKNFMLYEAISVLQEEGADVVSANFSTVGCEVFHTIHAQVRVTRVGVEISRIYQRLKELVSV